MPWPLNTTMPVEQCASLLADAIESRSRRVYIPGGIRLISMLRPLSLSGVGTRLFARRNGGDLRQLDRENEALGATWR
jgi:hypothetical protein